jgi:hypothetical protein
MREPYTEGPATHGDPESCVGGARDQPKAAGEALTGACIGRTTSREITQSGAPTPSPEAEGNTVPSENASSALAPRGLRTQACAETPCVRTGRTTDRPRAKMEARAATGRAQARSRR